MKALQCQSTSLLSVLENGILAPLKPKLSEFHILEPEHEKQTKAVTEQFDMSTLTFGSNEIAQLRRCRLTVLQEQQRGRDIKK